MAKKKAGRQPANDAPSFEQALESLERIVAELEGGKLGLSDALERYEEGVKHLKVCHLQLEQAERKIELLSGIDAAGNPITQPLDDQPDGSLAEKAAARGKRRSTKPVNRHPASHTVEDNDVDESGRLF